MKRLMYASEGVSIVVLPVLTKQIERRINRVIYGVVLWRLGRELPLAKGKRFRLDEISPL